MKQKKGPSGPVTNKSELIADDARIGVTGSPQGFELDAIDHKMLKHIMEYPETTNVQLAAVAGIAESTVRLRYKKPAFQNALKDLRASTWDLIERAQNMAIRKLMKLIQDPDKRIALEAAKYVLKPKLDQAPVQINQLQEIIYRTRFGEDGAIISDRVEIEATTPKNSLELLGIAAAEVLAEDEPECTQP